MPSSKESQAKGRSQEPAEGFDGHLDPGPPHFYVYLAVFTVIAGFGLFVWLGWSWLAIGLTPLLAAVVGALVFRRRRRGGDAYEAHYNEAHTKTVEYQARMHLDSKSPIGF